MFTLNDDLSIYATRGDIVFFSVSAQEDGQPYKFQAGDVLRIKVYGKKDAEVVVLQKDFPVYDVTENVEIFLSEEDTKIGEVISKPKDYWYEVELNPGDNPQTIIGYDEDGAKVFKLFPEGADIEEYVPTEEEIGAVDEELDMVSSRAVANKAVAKAIAQLTKVCEDTQDAVASRYVTPQLFGAVGDGENDDTKAIQDAIDSGFDVFFPAGTYLVSGTINVADKIRIYGVGDSIIKHTGEDFLLNVQTGYTNNAVIESLRFEGSASFLKCSKGAWGGKVIVRDVLILGFGGEVFHFESCFNPIVENCVILTDGVITFTTYDGTITETNFTNCAYFANVYITKYGENRIATMFDMVNVRDITFRKCQLENTVVLVSANSKTIGADFYNCWFENVTSLYSKDSTSSAPSVCDCKYVNVDSYNANEDTLDYIDGRSLLLQKATGASGLKTMLNNSVTLQQVNIYNPGDGYSDYTPAYKIATDETDFNQPLNKRTIYSTSVTESEFNLHKILRYSGADCMFKVVARMMYSDDSSKIVETKVLCLNGVYYVCDISVLKLTYWESSVSSTATETITCESGLLKLTSSATMSKCWLMIEFNFN